MSILTGDGQTQRHANSEEARTGILDFIAKTAGPRSERPPQLVFVKQIFERLVPWGELDEQSLSMGKRAKKALRDMQNDLIEGAVLIQKHWPSDSDTDKVVTEDGGEG